MPVVGLNHYNLQAPRKLLQELRNFYCEVVGFIEGPRPPFRSFGHWLYSGDRPILHLTEASTDEGLRVGGASTFDHAAFSCTALKQYEHRLSEMGVSYEVSVVPQTTQVQLFFSDPAGNGVELNFDEGPSPTTARSPKGKDHSMSIDVLFIHSAGPQSGEQGSSPFVKHLRQSLGSAFRVTCPAMPAPTKPSYERWKLELQKLLPSDKSPPILVGHSLGGSVLLKYISEHRPKVAAAGLFVVAAPYWGSTNWKAEEFVLRESFARSLPNALKIYLYQSRNDEAVDIEHLSRYSRAIPQAKVRIVDGGGHTFKDGLLELADDIQALANSLASKQHDGA